MYAAPFEYHAPSTVAEAVSLLERHADDAKLIAGSQSLVPLMKLRLATPAHIIDLQRVPGLTGVRDAGGVLQIGALTTHHAIGRDATVRAKQPAMAEAAALIGDAQVRNLGTIGGSLAHADPAADWPALLLALDATVQVMGSKGERALRIDELIVGPLSTSLAHGELITQVRVPVAEARSGCAYEKHPHPASRFAIVSAAVSLQLDANGAVQNARVVIGGLGPKASRAQAVERVLTGKAPDAASLKAAATLAAQGIAVRADLDGSADYKAHLAAVFAERALQRAAARATGR
jgi:carbon-monoxide dehydrogenase medium subunit